MSPPPQVQDVAQRFMQALKGLEEQGEAALGELLGLFAEDATLRTPIVQREKQALRGREAIAGFWREYLDSFGEIHSDFSEVTVNGHATGLFWHSRGTDHHGQPVEYEGVTLLRLDGSGRIAEFQAYFDSRDVAVDGEEPAYPRRAGAGAPSRGFVDSSNIRR